MTTPARRRAPSRLRFIARSLALALVGLGLASVPAGAAGVTTPKKPTVQTSAVLRPGPVPDFAPIADVIIHGRLKGLAPEVHAALTRTLGAALTVDTYEPCGAHPGILCERWPVHATMIWARDYYPIPIRAPDGRLELLKYYSPNPNRTEITHRVAGMTGHPVNLAVASGAARIRTMPLIHENGNLVTDGKRLFVSDLLISTNVQLPGGFDASGSDVVARTPDAIIRLFAESLYRRPDEVVVLPALPGDQSRHVDMYLMAVDAETLLVPQIRAEAILASAEGMERNFAFQASSMLDGVSSMLASRGLIVERLPMPGPVVLSLADQPGTVQVVYDTPTNAVLLNVKGRKHALLPSMRVEGRSPRFEALRARYERQWVDFFQQRGYASKLVDVGGLAVRAGLLHCVTATLPDLSEPQKRLGQNVRAQNGSGTGH